MPHDYVIKIPPLSYLHLQDLNLNVTRLVVGPQTYTCLDHQRVILGPEAMIVIPPRHYCLIENPVIRTEDGQVLVDNFGQAKLKHGDREFRFEQEPFPLYPGERLVGKMSPLLVVPQNAAILLRAERDFVSGKRTRQAGEEWIEEGPLTYHPRVEVSVVERLEARVVAPGCALRLCAKRDCLDKQYNISRRTGEQWLMREPGAYLPSVDETLVCEVRPQLLDEQHAIHLKALANFTDVYNITRQAGDHWLITHNEAKSHLVDVNEELVGLESIISLTARQYCTIANPVDQEGKHKLGTFERRRGPQNFFLQPPFEVLHGPISQVYVLPATEALKLQAKEGFRDEIGNGISNAVVHRAPGEQWLFYGPGEYWPPLEVEFLQYVHATFVVEPLGIYIFRPWIAVFWVVLALLSLVFLYLVLSLVFTNGHSSIEL